jgi:hypothetical protein
VDEDLADLYGVETRRLVEQVRRNAERFPPEDLERDAQAKLGRHDQQLEAIFAALRPLMNSPRVTGPIGFIPPAEDA